MTPGVVAAAFLALDRLQALGMIDSVGVFKARAVTCAGTRHPRKRALGTVVWSLFPAEELNASRYNPGFDRTAATLLRPVDASAFGSREPFERRSSGLSFAGDPRRDRCAMLACRFIWSYKY